MLFSPNEYGVSIFGETANGNVDSQPQKNVLHSTTTVTQSVSGPTAAVPTPTPSPSATPSLRAKPAFKTASNGSDPSIKKHFKSTRVLTRDRLEHNAGGGGIQLDYFYTRYMGIALESDFLGGNPYNTAATANLIFRYPFEFGAEKVSAGYSKDAKDVRSGKDAKDGKTTEVGPIWGLAPYIVIGGGCQWDGRAEGIGDVGGGIEFRFQKHCGIFLEGRWFVHDARQNYAAETAGFTYTF